MAIAEFEDPKRPRQKNGEEIFELITQRPMRSELGNSYRVILKIAYEHSLGKNPFFQIQTIDSITRTAIIMLTVLHNLLENRRRPDLKQEYKLTKKGESFYEHLFLEPPLTLH